MRYVAEVIGPSIISTMPEHTLRAFADHGTVARTIDTDPAAAEQALAATASAGIDLAAITSQLEREGVRSSATPTTSCWAASSANSPPPLPGNSRSNPATRPSRRSNAKAARLRRRHPAWQARSAVQAADPPGGMIEPEFAGTDLGVAEKLAARAAATVTGADPEQLAALAVGAGEARSAPATHDRRCRCLSIPGGHACQMRPNPAATTLPQRSKA